MSLPTDQKAGGSNPSRRAEHLGWSGPQLSSTTSGSLTHSDGDRSHVGSRVDGVRIHNSTSS